MDRVTQAVYQGEAMVCQVDLQEELAEALALVAVEEEVGSTPEAATPAGESPGEPPGEPPAPGVNLPPWGGAGLQVGSSGDEY